MSRARAYSHVLLLVAVLGGACSPSVEPIVAAPGCPDRPLRGPEQYASEPADRMLSDFEGGSVELAKVANRDGSWVYGRDLTSTRVIIQPSTDCAARDQWAGHFAASTPTKWGNNWTAYFKSGTATPYDGSVYKAVSFWAAFGGDTTLPVPFGIVTTDTIRPSCSTHCDDHYMKGVMLTHDWTRYQLDFDQLTQTTAPQIPMRRDQLVGFIIWPRQQCDIWIDDVRLEP